MNTVTISKTEYKRLKLQSRAYKELAGKFFKFAIKDPVKEVIDDFKKQIFILMNFYLTWKMD